ncbi:hypothetical protein GDO86_002202 [Hymenochirus boettgeri]|uniref:RING-type E3 ubiquitin transferase n=1 Tax=Hymenochirus boettgeri TaxID=247094 RepID=A0A8T2KIH0_9PIPI|nr:hypothetical protein GDO86_002202 [Hymenochirus boettgeri]KAG8456322.1 hypothetical protein GDO86_002202 [Hymenochirus boettgeri]KAG8456323.1 hypothetical protein GDO86_002202 [Hymenochirus boettgeri]
MLSADLKDSMIKIHTEDDLESSVMEDENESFASESVYARSCQSCANEDDQKYITTWIDTSIKYQNGNSFLNIDSFEPESSEEEEICASDDFALTEEIGKIVESRLLEPEHVETVCKVKVKSPRTNHSRAKDSLSKMWPVSLCKKDFSSTQGKWNLTRSLSKDDTRGIANLGMHESQMTKNTIDVALKNTIGFCSEISANKPEQGALADPAVRPKVRIQSVSSSGNKNSSLKEWNKENATARKGNLETQDKVEGLCKNETSCEDVHCDPIHAEGARKEMYWNESESSSVQTGKSAVDDTFWDNFFGRKLSSSNKDDESDGEWSSCYFSSDKDHSSSDESWETLPWKEEHEGQSNSSSLEEENSDFCFQVEDQTCLEDGEIPWLQYHEDIESSTDEENEIGNHFVYPGFFILDGNNNLEDDSSMSEDLEVEWRLLDDFGDGLGIAQAASYVDPQFLTYMALEERLAQAMETALAHLESLAVDVEQAHPPATKETIDCLPQIIISDDRNVLGQEQCCAICFCEYIRDEILTELPCHHLFHKPCVNLWLQKSGTCPVCRYVLATSLPEASSTSFLSDHESPPSVHSAAGTR